MVTFLPLTGKNIVVTRPEIQAGPLCKLIEHSGGKAVRFPVLAIDSIPDSTERTFLIDRLHHFDVAFFVSPNAVKYGIEAVQARRPWPPALRVATVGMGSEEALHQQGFTDIIVPSAGFDSEAVLTLEAFSQQAVDGKKIVIFRGDAGRDLLGKVLKERGAAIEYLACYRRYRPDIDPKPLIRRAEEGDVHALTLTSSEGVKNFVELVGAEGRLFFTLPVFVSHSRIAQCARDVGFVQVIQTASGDSGMMDSLLSWRWT